MSQEKEPPTECAPLLADPRIRVQITEPMDHTAILYADPAKKPDPQNQP